MLSLTFPNFTADYDSFQAVPTFFPLPPS